MENEEVMWRELTQLIIDHLHLFIHNSVWTGYAVNVFVQETHFSDFRVT